MSLGLKIDVKRYGDAEAPARVAAVLSRERSTPVIGQAAARVFVRHLRRLDRQRPNRLGGARQHFYNAAAQGTSWAPVVDGVLVSIASVGIRQRYFGGTIKPGPGKRLLAFPIHPESYGKTTKDFPDMYRIFNHEGRPSALARPVPGRAFGEILFALAPQVVQKADPTVLPPDAEVLAAADKAMDSVVQRAWRREGRTPPGSAQPPATP